MHLNGQINPMADWECSFTMVHLKEDIRSQSENMSKNSNIDLLFKVNTNLAR